MTNRDRLISLLGFTPAKDSIDGTLLEAGIVGGATYDGSNKVSLKRCAIELMELLLTTPNQTNDVGMVITYDRGAVEKLIARYKVDIGDAKSTRATLRDKSWLH